MVGRSLCAVTLLLATAGIGRAAEETPTAHSAHPSKTIVLDNESIRPSSLTMGTGDLLVFENHSLHPISVTFEEPKDMREKIRCQLLDGKVDDKERAPWMLFGWNAGRLSGVIPPGRFASLCSLTPGQYSFTVVPQSVAIRAPGQGAALPAKGQITVE